MSPTGRIGSFVFLSIFLITLLELSFRRLHIRTCGHQRMVSEWQILKSHDQRTTNRHSAHVKHQLEDKNLSVPLWRKCSMIITHEHNMYSLCPASIYSVWTKKKYTFT